MKQLNSLQNLIFLAGGALMVIGVALNFFDFQQVASCLFLLGAVCFGGMQMMQTYEGNNVVIRRLRRIMTLADVLFIVSGLLLLEQNFNFLMPLFQKNGMQGMIYYAQYVVHNNWVLVLFVAALLELYTMHRISSELAEEAKKL
jgi:hypothetical protein